MIEFLEKIGVPLLVGFIGAFFAAKLAISKHRMEKVWEKKVEAYSDLIDTLHDLKRTREVLHAAESKGHELQEKVSSKHWDRSRNARRRVEKAIDTSAFIVSEEMGLILENFEEQMELALQNEDEWADVLGAEYQAVCKCLNSIKEQSKKELKI